MIAVESNMELVPDLWKFILTYTPSSVLTLRCVNRYFRDTLKVTEENPCLLALRDNNPRIIPWLLEVYKIPNNFVIEAARYLELSRPLYPLNPLRLEANRKRRQISLEKVDLAWLLELSVVKEWLSSLEMSTDAVRTLIVTGACVGSKVTTLDFLYDDGYKFTASDLIIAFSYSNREVCEYVTRRHETFIDSRVLCEKAVEHSNLESLKYLLEIEDVYRTVVKCAIRRSNDTILKFLFEDKKPTIKHVVYALSVDNLELAKSLYTLSKEILTKECVDNCIFMHTRTFEMVKWLISLGIEIKFFVEEARQFVSVELLEWIFENGYEFEDIAIFIQKYVYNTEVMKWLCEKKYVIPGDGTMLLAAKYDRRELFELLLARNHTPSVEVMEVIIEGDKKEMFKLVSNFYTTDLLRLAITHGSIKIIKLLLKLGYCIPEDSFDICLEKDDYYTLGFLYGRGLVITKEHISLILDYNIAVTPPCLHSAFSSSVRGKYLEFLENYGYKFSYEDYLRALKNENEIAAEFIYSTLSLNEKLQGYVTSFFST